MSDLSSFSIQNPKQIVSHLTLLLKSKSLLTARFGAGSESYITTLLSINSEKNLIAFDCGSKEDVNQRILNAGKLAFDAEYNGIKVSFVGAELKKITHNGDPAFCMPMPRSIYWLQRREYYRVKSPLSKSSYCQLILKDREPVNLKLYDLSLTGFAMLNVSREISELLVPGEIHENCKLILAEVGEAIISFEIRAKYIINPDKLQKIQKIGCQFVNIKRSAEEIIQNYMHQIQREDLKKD